MKHGKPTRQQQISGAALHLCPSEISMQFTVAKPNHLYSLLLTAITYPEFIVGESSIDRCAATKDMIHTISSGNKNIVTSK